MNYRKLAAIAAVLTMLTSAVSCGHESDGGDVADTNPVVTDEGNTDAEESSETTGTGTATTSKKSDKTTAATTDKSTKTTTTAKAGGTASGGTTVGGNSSGGSSAKTTQAASGGGSSSQETTSDSGEKVYDAEIKLGSLPTVSGSGATVDGKTVTITAGGDYIFTGTVSDGQIRVNVPGDEDNVTIVLNGVDISNSTAPAIFIEDAKRCTIKPKEGSVNYLSSDCEK